MANLSVLMHVEHDEILTQRAILERSTPKKTDQWKARKDFVSRYLRSVYSLEEQRRMGVSNTCSCRPKLRPRAKKRCICKRGSGKKIDDRRGHTFSISDLLLAVNYDAFESEALKILKYLDCVISELIRRAPKGHPPFNPHTTQGMKTLDTAMDFFYAATPAELKAALSALKQGSDHPIANQIRTLPRELLSGIRDAWLGHPIVFAAKTGKAQAQSNARMLYTSAFTAYKAGQFGQAANLIDTLLAMEGISMKMRDNCCFLMGMIAKATNATTLEEIKRDIA